MDKNSLHFRGTYRNVYEVNRAYAERRVDGDYVDITDGSIGGILIVGRGA